MAYKTTWEKLTDKVTKIRLEDFTPEEQQKIMFGSCHVVVAKDKFLSGWGVAENQNCYQVVICFTGELFYYVRKHFKHSSEFSRVFEYLNFEDFLKSRRKGVLTVKNARLCHAWNGEREV